MTFIATLTVPATRKLWPADEVPSLTAGALYPVPDAPEPPVRELLRIDMRDGRPAESPLSGDDLATLKAGWQAKGLPPITGPMTAHEWVRYLVSFNEAPDVPNWQFAVRPPADPHLSQRLQRILAEEEHTKALKSALDAGVVRARHAGSLVPANAWLSLRQLVLNREALNQFCELVCIQVADETPQSSGAGYGFPAAPIQAEPTLGRDADAVLRLEIPSKASPAPLTTPEIADAFNGIDGQSSKQWRSKLGDVNNHQWLMSARAEHAPAPKPATWWPIAFAELLRARGASDEGLNRAFLAEPKLKPWMPLWQEKRRERNAFGQ